MGNSGSSMTALQTCLNNVCNGRSNCVAYPSNPLYKINWVTPYNLDLPVTPIAVTRPSTSQDVSGIVKCAVANNVKVQAKSGGHSYANYGWGGSDGELVIDMVNFQDFSMDTSTWQATIGAGTALKDVTSKLHDNGARAIAHGTCPGVGIGGHATIGGLGPMSRMWGSCLDHVMEVEVVTADGNIQRASDTQNSDLFFALKGAGAGFGVITEFVMKTHPEPGSIVQYSYTFNFGKFSSMASVFQQWQALIADPNLDWRFGSEFTFYELGVIISGTFYGTQDEFEASGIPARIPAQNPTVTINNWLGAVAQQAEDAALSLSDLRTSFSARSLAFSADEILSTSAITSLMSYLDNSNRGTLTWFLIFDASGGYINTIPMNATAYSQRDKVMFCQGYGIGIPTLSSTTKNFIDNIITTIQSQDSAATMTYPGYVDPLLTNPQQSYWGPNLATLQSIKSKWDPADVFHNPQSVRPQS